MPPLPLGKTGARFGEAMNKLGWHWWPSDTAIATDRIRGPRAAASISAIARPAARRAPRPAPTSPTGRTRSAPASNCARAAGCARSPSTNDGMATGVIYYDADGEEQFQPAEVVIVACNGIGTPRLLLNSASAQVSQRPRQFQRAGRQEPDVPSVARTIYGYVDEPLDGNRGAAAVPVEPGVLRDRPRAAVSCAAIRLQFSRGAGAIVEAIASTARGRAALGRGPSRRLSHAAQPHASACRRSARTCRKSTTASRSIRC